MQPSLTAVNVNVGSTELLWGAWQVVEFQQELPGMWGTSNKNTSSTFVSHHLHEALAESPDGPDGHAAVREQWIGSW